MNIDRLATVKLVEHSISNSHCEKVFGFKIDSQLCFNNHLERIINKASQKLLILAKMFKISQNTMTENMQYL